MSITALLKHRRSRWSRVIGIAIAAVVLGGGSCVGPAEFTNGLPDEHATDIDQRLPGWWYGVDEGDKLGSPAVLLGVLPTEEGVGIHWLYPTLNLCFQAIAVPRTVAGATYLDARPEPPDKEGLTKCEYYAGEGVPRGHIIAIARIDDADRLYLRFVRNSTLLRLRNLGHFDARVVRTEEEYVVRRYLLADLASEDLATLLRGIPEEGLFDEPIGPFFRLETNLPPLGRSTNPSGPLPSEEAGR